MKNIKKLLLVLSFVLAYVSSSSAGAVVVETKALGAGITTDTVRIVFKTTASFVDREIGFILHENETDIAWDFTMAATMLNHYTVDGVQVLKHVGYSGAILNWDTGTNFKLGEKEKEVAVWLFLDATNDTYGLAVQIEGENEVTTLFNNYLSRESAKGANTATAANYATLFFNDAGNNTAASVEIIESATIVSSIEPYPLGTVTKLEQKREALSFMIQPSIANNNISIVSSKDIHSISVMSIAGKELKTGASNSLDISTLTAGIYVVKATATDGTVGIQKFIKK